MKHTFLLLFIVSFLTACHSKNNKVSEYFSAQEQDSLLTNIITYISSPAPQANNTTKFQSQFRGYYLKALPNFSIENYYQANDGWNYIFLTRPVGGSPTFRRGVLAKFKLQEGSFMPQAFEEIINTPHLKEEIVKERGGFLFKMLIKEGNIDKYLPMKQYIEWPDDHLKYNKNTHEWVIVKPY